jgi:hypothetical protein
MPLTAALPTIGTLDTTLPDTSDPQYQSASLALDLHKLLKNMSDAGMVISQAVSTDFTTFAGDVTDGMDDYIERYEEILANGFSSIVANIPDVLPIITTLLSGGSEPVLAILLKGVLDVLLRQFDARITDNEGEIEAGTADMSGVEAQLEALEDKLEEMRVQIATILTEFNITVVQTREALDDVAEWTVGFPVPPA